MRNSDYLVLMMRKALRKLDPRRWLFLDPLDRGRSIYLASSARSGSSWLQDILNFDGNARVMFEPMRVEDVPLVSGFAQRQYIRPGNVDAKFIEPMTAIVTGRVRNKWIDQYNRKMITKGRVIKDVRSNLLLGWLRQSFPEMPIVLLLRHPCAVAVSRRERGFETHLDVYISQEQLVEDHLSGVLDFIKSVNSEFGKHILMWCIENVVPLRQLEKEDVHLVFYENLCADPKTAIRNLFKSIGYSSQSLQSPSLQRMISKPSLLSRKESAVLSRRNLVSAWQKKVSTNDLGVALRCLKEFGLSQIYASDPMPLVGETVDIFDLIDRAK